MSITERLEYAETLSPLLLRWEVVAVNRIRRVAERHRLSLNEILVVAELFARPHGLPGSEIAVRVGLGSGGISMLLARLEERDFVERFPDPLDRRNTIAVASPEARRELWPDLLVPDVDLLLTGLDEQQAAAARRFVGAAVDAGIRRAFRASTRDHRRRQEQRDRRQEARRRRPRA
ncbi:MarR family winged helix-turn-helix transcriptional regulator [Pseudonocardia phyllosphaerae]|uniref:MarR family winged helix-turn-helix transcriptional regulator n=1 Tax=Pseudonocardia phyllosphaerae TaxID=3390502 RepID=UPI00397BAC9B